MIMSLWPRSSGMQFIHPTYGLSDQDREDSILRDSQRCWDMHSAAGARSRWIAVRDSTTKAIVGVTRWMFHTNNPWPNGLQPIDAPWWPEGEGRRFTGRLFEEMSRTSAMLMRRPHASGSS